MCFIKAETYSPYAVIKIRLSPAYKEGIQAISIGCKLV
jgi:hypothetical protein